MGPRVITDQKVASNPVARAVARQKLRSSLLTLKLQVYSLERGDACAKIVGEVSGLLALVGMAGERDPAIGGDHLSVRIIKGGLSALAPLAKSNKWDPAQSIAVESALDAAESLSHKAHSRALFSAWADLNISPLNF